MTAVPQPSTKVVTQASNLVTQILQSGTIVQQAKPGTVTVSQGKVIPNTGGQAKVVTQGQTGMVVTQIPQAAGKAGRYHNWGYHPVCYRNFYRLWDHLCLVLIVGQGVPGQTRAVSVSQAGLIQGSQLIMQGQGQPKVVTPQQLLAGGYTNSMYRMQARSFKPTFLFTYD